MAKKLLKFGARDLKSDPSGENKYFVSYDQESQLFCLFERLSSPVLAADDDGEVIITQQTKARKVPGLGFVLEVAANVVSKEMNKTVAKTKKAVVEAKPVKELTMEDVVDETNQNPILDELSRIAQVNQLPSSDTEA